jgi:hypothetical protein
MFVTLRQYEIDLTQFHVDFGDLDSHRVPDLKRHTRLFTDEPQFFFIELEAVAP